MSVGFSRRRLILAGGAALAGAAWPALIRAQSSTIKVGTGKIEPQAEAYYAADAGIFKQHGLDVDVRQLLNAGLTASAVAGGDLQFGSSTTLNIAQAHEHGVPFVIVASGAHNDPKIVIGQLCVPKTSTVTSAKDLNGKTVAIETLNGLAALTVMATIDDAGGDASTVKFVEIPAASMPDALAQNRIAAALLQEPILSASADRVRAIATPNDAIGGHYVSIVWFTTSSYLAGNKDVARRFAQSIYAAGAWAMANPQLAAESLERHLGIKEPAARQQFATGIDIGDYRHLFDVASKYKFITPLKPEEIVWDGK